jgi:Spy/CpxP family protein refolding chaperone
MKRIVFIAAVLALLLAPQFVAAQGQGPLGPGKALEPMAEPGQQPMPSRAMAPRAPMPGPRDLGAWWKNSEVVKELGLSEAQVKQIEQTFYDHRLKLIDLRADVERQETRLQPLIEADQLDEAKISAQLDTVLAARSKLEKANTMMMLSIRKVLSLEQWKKLQEMHHQREFGHPPRPPMQPRMPGPAHPAKTPRPPDAEQEPY